MKRCALLLFACVSAAPLGALAQPPGGTHRHGQQPAAGAGSAAGRAPFVLSPAEQTYLDQVLAAWEAKSDTIKTFRCPFTKWVYGVAGPHPTMHSVEERGEVSYQKPDKGKYQVTRMWQWKADPVAPGQAAPPGQAPKGRHVELNLENGDAVGDHWVSDGKQIYQYRPHEKKLVVTPIPPEMQGERIVEGPFPFLFGAKADELKQRFWMRPQECPDKTVIELVAWPRTLRDAGSYQMVQLRLDRNTLLPRAMQIYAPSGEREVFAFQLDEVKVNEFQGGPIWQALFNSPRTPRGWQRVVVDTAPIQQAAQPPVRR